MRPQMTYEIAHAAGTDAANRSLRKARRKCWNQEDYDTMWREFDRLWPVEQEIQESRAACQRAYQRRDALETKGANG